MYEVQKLTQPEKVLISNTLYPAGIALEHAWYMLEGVLDLFGPAPHALRDDEAERLWHVIDMTGNTIYDALTYFCLTTGDENWPGVKSFKRSAAVVLEREGTP